MVKHENIRGFTLLEILIAISIMSILVVILIAGLQVGIKSWEKGSERVDSSQNIRIIQDLIFQDIRSCYPYQIKILNKRTLVFNGEPARIDFISASSSFLTKSKNIGLREVSYYIDDDPSTEEEGLVMREAMITGREDVFSEDRGLVVELDPNVRSISFRYFIAKDSLRTKDSDLENGQWLDRWNSMDTSMEIPTQVGDEELQEQITLYAQRYFPRAIEVTMEVEVKRGKSSEVVLLPSLVIPIKTGQHFSSTRRRRRRR